MPTENDLLLLFPYPLAGVVETGDATPSALPSRFEDVGTISSFHSLQGTAISMALHFTATGKRRRGLNRPWKGLHISADDLGAE